MADMPLPKNTDAEEALLGSILINPDCILDVATFLTVEHFWLVRNGMVYEALLKLFDERKPIDFITVTTELENQGRLKEIGGILYISKLMDAVPSAIHAEAYAKIVEDAGLRRSLLVKAADIAKLAYDESKDITDVLQQSEKAVFDVAEKRIGTETIHISKAVSMAITATALAEKSGGIVGIPTGMIDVDKMLGGLKAGDLDIVAGRPGMGKSALLMSVGLHAARMGKRVALFSLEMDAEQLAQRMIAAYHNMVRPSDPYIDTKNIRQGTLNDTGKKLYLWAAEKLAMLEMHIEDGRALSPMGLRTKSRRIAAYHGLDLILVDYLQLLEGDWRFNNRQEEISYISRQLKRLAGEMGVPVVAAAQLNRGCEMRHDKRPMLADLRESGAIENDADVVMFLYRDEYYTKEETEKPTIAELNVAKQRNGPLGTVDLYFQKESVTFRNLERYQFSQENPYGREKGTTYDR